MTIKVHGLRKLNRQLQSYARRTLPNQFRHIQNGTARGVLRDVVVNTPRDRGEHVNGWNVGVNQPAPIVKNPPFAPSGSAPLRRGNALIAKAPPFSRIEIANGVRAINVLDKGGFVPSNPGPSKDPRPGRKGRTLVINGYSRQAPVGMTRIATRNAPGRIRKLAEQARRGVLT